MSAHQYEAGQRWRYRNNLEEFEDTLVIDGIVRLSFFRPGTPDQYFIHICSSNVQSAIHSQRSVALAVTADALDKVVLELVESNAPIERSRGGATGDDIEPLLRYYLSSQRRRERGRELSSQAPTLEEVKKQLGPWLAKHTRKAWRPVIQKREISVVASKFCGTPWLAADEPWPVCRYCQSPMPLFLQLNSQDLSVEFGRPFGDGILQFFCCADPNYNCKPGWEPNRGISKLLRIVQPGDISESRAIPPSLETDFPCRTIAGWKEVADVPDGEEHEELGLNYHYDHGQRVVRVECPSLSLAFDNLDSGACEYIAKALKGDKLAGWPRWIQRVEYPNCPKCNKRMRYLFQIDSQDNVPHMFGDCGCAHISCCPDHPDILGFDWACC